VIKHFGEENNLTPALGLWKEHFAEGLLWPWDGPIYFEDNFVRRINSPEFLMPSWPWLGVKGLICSRPYDEKPEDIIVPAIDFDLQCHWDGPELVGRLLEANLSLRGVIEGVRITGAKLSSPECS
jgi:hypothetical protein